MASIKYRLGVDIGGTFTDFTLINPQDGHIWGLKTPTVPLDPAQGIVNGLRLLAEKGIKPGDIGYFVHGTTIGLNTLLQRRGEPLALFVTEGFRDLLSLQRLRLPVPYDFRSRLPEPLVPRKMVFGIRERMLADGTELEPLDPNEVDRAVDQAKAAGAQGIAICYLHSYKNAAHEKETAERILKRAPELNVCMSSFLWPEMREYERAVMTVINLYIQANVREYFGNLKKALVGEGVAVAPFITQSNGGIMDVDSAAAAPIRTLFSGPAAGVIGAMEAARASGIQDLITFDMGGTSTDISVIENGNPSFTQSSELGGFPVLLPTIDIASIGAGGGSVGWIDNGGLLKVGPLSAGSDPGPACYGKSDQPAMTDAFLICGYLNPQRFAASRLKLDPRCAERALEPLAAYLKTDVRSAADQMIQISISNMYAELSSVMEQRGFDPRDFSVVAFGGAGPVTANFIAEEIQAKNVLIPPSPGTLCALGSLTADFIYDAVKSRQVLLDELTGEELRAEFDGLKQQARNWLDRQKVSILEGHALQYSMDMRYQGQAYEIELPVDDRQLNESDFKEIFQAFHQKHQAQYGHSNKAAAVEIVNLRVKIRAFVPKAAQPVLPESDEAAVPVGARDIVCRGKSCCADIYLRDDLRAGQAVEGPAVIEQDDTTVLILPGWLGKVERTGSILISRKIGRKGVTD